MPTWQPNWQDVRWSDEAAGRAAAELRRLADDFELAWEERARAAEEATREWRGPHRRHFDDRLAELRQRNRSLAEECRAAAVRIDAATRRAHDEQARRVRDRQRWRVEKESEDRRGRRG
jgi:ElaB/YqjD/DUF883 family membrane-anchored ribosome-binding protein